MKRVDIKCACFFIELFVYGVGNIVFCLLNHVGELECCYYSNVTPIWVEFIGGWIGSIIFLLGLRVESTAWGMACQGIWWEVSFL